MKNIGKVLLILLFAVSCKKNEVRRSGVCYCEFFKGADQVYDLSTLPRQDQMNACNTHDTNAAKFGGHCKLE